MPAEVKRGYHLPEAKVTGSCEPGPGVGAGN